jgi:23S rRNA (uracil1939-C5)-methyltransferase
MKLQIEKAVYGGAGLAHQTEGADEGKTVFVPFTLPGEVIEDLRRSLTDKGFESL